MANDTSKNNARFRDNDNKKLSPYGRSHTQGAANERSIREKMQKQQQQKKPAPKKRNKINKKKNYKQAKSNISNEGQWTSKMGVQSVRF